MSFEIFSQWYIGIIGAFGFFLIAKKNPWGFVATLSTEPLWFISTWQKEQWGMFFLTVIYTASCVYGFWKWVYADKKDSYRLHAFGGRRFP